MTIEIDPTCTQLSLVSLWYQDYGACGWPRGDSKQPAQRVERARLTLDGSVSAMTRQADSATDVAAVDELRFLADLLRRVAAAAAAADWDGDSVLARVVAEA